MFVTRNSLNDIFIHSHRARNFGNIIFFNFYNWNPIWSEMFDPEQTALRSYTLSLEYTETRVVSLQQ